VRDFGRIWLRYILSAQTLISRHLAFGCGKDRGRSPSAVDVPIVIGGSAIRKRPAVLEKAAEAAEVNAACLHLPGLNLIMHA